METMPADRAPDGHRGKCQPAGHCPTVAVLYRSSMRRVAVSALVAVIVAFGAAQLIPYRVSNPPARNEPVWDSPRTRELAVTACFDCHSNQTHSPWYAKVAPMSWLTTRDVRDGRAAMNFSEWGSSEGGHNPGDVVAEGSMPPGRYFYFGLHKHAKLSATDKADLIRGLRALADQLRRGGNSGRGGP
jgi:hypothetical protein